MSRSADGSAVPDLERASRAELSTWAPAAPAQEALRREFLARLDEGPDALQRTGRPAHLTASALVLDRSGRSVLLVLHGKVRLWLQPGGHLEVGDRSLAAAALREAVEETGVPDLALVDRRPLHLDRHRAPCGAEHHLDVRFAVVAPDGAAPRVSEESLDVAWFPLDALPARRSPDLDRLLAAASDRSQDRVRAHRAEQALDRHLDVLAPGDGRLQLEPQAREAVVRPDGLEPD